MPFSRSRSSVSITRGATSWPLRNAPDCHSIASTSVVLPWSTWATMATLRMSARSTSMALSLVGRSLRELSAIAHDGQSCRGDDVRMGTDGVVIAGGGLAAQRCAETLRRAGYEGRIRVLCAEPRAPYDRPPLSKEMLGASPDESAVGFRGQDFYEGRAIELVLDTRATALDPVAQRLRTSAGEELGYEQLVIATGSAPRTLPAFAPYENVSTLRTLEDARRLRELLHAHARLLIVGAGFIGQEVAAAARAAGAPVTVVELEPAPLHALLGAEIGGWFARLHQEEGVELLLGRTIATIHGGRRVEAVTSTTVAGSRPTTCCSAS